MIERVSGGLNRWRQNLARAGTIPRSVFDVRIGRPSGIGQDMSEPTQTAVMLNDCAGNDLHVTGFVDDHPGSGFLIQHDWRLDEHPIPWSRCATDVSVS